MSDGTVSHTDTVGSSKPLHTPKPNRRYNTVSSLIYPDFNSTAIRALRLGFDRHFCPLL
jgi:hypothetical protein